MSSNQEEIIKKLELEEKQIERESVGFLVAMFMKRNPAEGFAMQTEFRREVATQLLNSIKFNGKCYKKTFFELKQWAMTEHFNRKSAQMSKCPFALVGSGRWQAADYGGRYYQLKEIVISTIEQLNKNSGIGEFFKDRSVDFIIEAIGYCVEIVFTRPFLHTDNLKLFLEKFLDTHIYFRPSKD